MITPTQKFATKTSVPENWHRIDLLRLGFVKGKAPKHLIDSADDGYMPYLSPDYLRNITNEVLYCPTRQAVSVGKNEPIVLWDGSNAGEVFLSKEGALASTMCKITTTEPTLLPKYLFYFLKSRENEIKSRVKGSGIPHVDKYIFGELNSFFPVSEKEQQLIVTILTVIDDLIECTEAVVSKLKHLKQGLMHDLLTRGIDENGVIRSEKTHRFKNSPLGRIPEEWDVVELETLKMAITSGSRAWAAYYSDDGPLFIRIGNLTRDHINLRLDDLMHVNPPAGSEGSRTRIDEGDVLISITADLGIIGIAPDDLGEAYVNQHIALVKLDRSKANPRWIGYYLANEQGQKQFYHLNDPGAKAGLNLPTVGRLLVLLPPAREQEKIVAVADAHVSGIHAEEAYRDKLKHLKRGLMEDLLTGRLRVNHLLKE
jgi:type I restriction enzyme, S subunit